MNYLKKFHKMICQVLKGGIKMAKQKTNIGKRKVAFSLSAPEAKCVAVLGDFNKWNTETHAMKKDENGVWHKIAMLSVGRYEYRFLVDGQWRNDPKNDQACWNSFGTKNNILDVRAHERTRTSTGRMQPIDL
jgi:1,4-alpha-glucan branching enzyme